MKVAVLHGAVPPDARADELDVLVEAREVAEALERIGHEPYPVTFTLDLRDSMARLQELRPELVFNLVESVEGSGRLIHLAPAVLDHLGLPYTGAGTEAQFATSNKLLSKKLLRGAGIPTAPWVGLADRASTAIEAGQRYIVKSVWEHASVGLDEESVLTPTSTAELNDTLRARRAELGGDCFAERFIEGREFNLSVLGGPDGPQVLPPAEIDFSAYPEGKMRVVGFRAKWDESSFEYLHTPRTFDFAGEDALLGRLMDLARQSWRLFDLRGHARVDFRVDREGEPWVLEVNTNPCISPDAGFIAAAGRAGLSIDDVLRHIIADSMP